MLTFRPVTKLQLQALGESTQYKLIVAAHRVITSEQIEIGILYNLATYENQKDNSFCNNFHYW